MDIQGWANYKLGDLVTFQRGHDLPVSKTTAGPYPVVGSNGIISYHTSYTTKKPCITVGRSGNSVGVVHYYDCNCWAHNTTLYVKEFKNNIHQKFLYYYIKTLHLDNYGGGSAVPTLNRNHIHPIEVYVPVNYEEQRVIAHILSSLDDQIELNNHINKTLEEMAQAIFISWFLDFEPFRNGEFEDSELGEIPKGWKIKSLDEIANYINGLAMQKYRPEGEEYIPVIKIREMNMGKIDEQSNKASPNIDPKYIVKNGDVLFSWSGSLDIKVWCSGTGGLNQHIFKVTSVQFDKWFYYYWTKHYIDKFRRIAADKATTMGHIQRKHLSESKVIVPDQVNYKKISKIIKPIFEQIINNMNQNYCLVNIRDNLLPKLMSGEIRVPIVDIPGREAD